MNVLLSDKATIIIRAMLSQFDRKWVARDFEKEFGVGRARAATVLSELRQKGFVGGIRSGRLAYSVLQNKEELIQEWPERNNQPRSRLDDKSGSSTWQSLTRQQGTVETDFLNGEIVHLAKRLGIQAPLNEKLLSICQEMATKHEQPGKYTPTELSRLLGLD